MRVQRKEMVVQSKAPPPAPFISDQELGACGKCEGYNCFGPHQKLGGGKVEVKCSYAKRLVVARSDIESHRDCPVFKENRPHG